MKAWRIIYRGLPDEPGIWIALTRSQAVAKARRQLAEVYGKQAPWSDFHATRAPEYDGWAARQKEERRGIGVDEGYVKQEVGVKA